MSDRGAIAPLDLAIGVMSLLHKGRRTATYKLAALSALIDYCDRSIDPTADGAVQVPIDVLAERVIGIYWRQVEGVDGGEPLLQSSEKASILEAVRKLRDGADVSAIDKRLAELQALGGSAT